MALTIRALFASLVLGLIAMAVMPVVATAQSSNAQLIVVTRTANGTTPSMAGTVYVTGTGPSLTASTTSSNSLTYTSSFAQDTRVVTLVAGSYSVAGTLSGSSMSYSSSCTGFIAAGEVRTCTITASGSGLGGTARVNVSVNVINDNGGSRTANDFVITVSGQNPNVSTFQGSTGSVQVSLGAGSYSIDAASIGSYFVSRSAECSGVIADNETRNCVITLNDQGGIYVPPSGNFGRLTCTPSRQSAPLGSTVSFTAQGGNGVYSWVTADRTFVGVGSRLNVILGTAGTQSVYVTSGYETASCIVDVTGTGSVLGTSTKIPGLPNTGYAPTSLGLILAMLGAFVALPAALFVLFKHGKATVASILG